ncbi:MAG: hypothetical protein J5679_02955 [Alphaproteobacteria bacterium]|nr:hypothetical protein [Alphaproteobacteria bacterium]
MGKTAVEKIGSEEFRKSAIDAMQKIVKDKSNTVIKKERTYRNPYLEIADDTCESVKYIVKAKNGKRAFSIKKIYIQGLGIYEFVLKIKCQNQSDKFSYGDLEKLYNTIEAINNTRKTREKVYSAKERKIVNFLSGFVR